VSRAAGRHLRRPRRAHLGVAGSSALIGGARIQAHQQLAGGHPVADLDVQLHHRAADLRGDHRLAQRLDDTVVGRLRKLRRTPRRHGRQFIGRSGPGPELPSQRRGQEPHTERGTPSHRIHLARRTPPPGMDSGGDWIYYLRNHAIMQVAIQAWK